MGNTGIVCCLSTWVWRPEIRCRGAANIRSRLPAHSLFIVFITAVVPFALMWPAGGLFKPFPLFVLFTVIGSVGGAALAFAAFWYFTVSHYPNAPPLSDLVPRGIAPGLFMAAILILNRWLSVRSPPAANAT